MRWENTVASKQALESEGGASWWRWGVAMRPGPAGRVRAAPVTQGSRHLSTQDKWRHSMRKHVWRAGGGSSPSSQV